MEWIILVTSAIGFLYSLYHIYMGIVGIFRTFTPIPHARAQKRIAAVIPARNEARVVPLLIDSLLKQRYPRALFDIYVIPNNCSDDTEGAARRAGAKILHCDVPVHSKGDVLRFAFDKLMKGPVSYDGYVIFDADNIVDSGFLQAANNALCAGYQAGQAYRDSKNVEDNWVSGCTSSFFWYMNRLFNQPRAILKLSAPLNGTGILIGKGLLEQIGYNTTTLTEDLEMTAQCALHGIKIAWMVEAITYDEQPLTLRDSFIQRRRWAAGSRQCASKYLGPLYRRAFQKKDRVSFDVAFHFTGVYAQVLGFVPGILTVALLIRQIIAQPVPGLRSALFALIAVILAFELGGAALTLLTCSLEGKLTKARIREELTMGWYLITWFSANLLGYLLPAPKWVEIPHTVEVGIDYCEQQEEDIAFQQNETKSL